MAGISIGELVGTISLQDQFSAGIEKVGEKLGLAGKTFGIFAGLAGGAAAGIATATTALVALGQHGSDVNDVKEAFGGLAAGVGSTADAMLGALQKGTLGTISNFDLMKAANGALGSGLITSSGQMQTLAAGAKLLADRTGGDTAQAFDTLTNAMATGRTASLKQLGIFVDNKKAVEDYARSIGKSTGDLTDHQRATALSQAALAALKTQLDASGGGTRDFADNINAAKVGVQNFVDNLASAVAASPVVMAGLDGIRQAFENAFGSDQQQAVKTLMGYVNQFAIFLGEAAGVGVEAARILVVGFTEAKVIFNTVLQALFDGIGKAAGYIADLADKATALPGIGGNFRDIADSAHATADMAGSLALGFGELKDKAQESAGAQMAAFDQVRAAIDKITAGMEAARDAQVDLANAPPPPILPPPATDTFIAPITAYRDYVADTAVQTAQKFQELQDQMTLANLTGTDARLAELDIARQKEIDGIDQSWAFQSGKYDEMVQMITDKYAQMAATATGYYATVQAAAAAEGFQTRAELEQTAATAIATYEAMKASGQFTAEAVRQAHEKAEKAKQAASEKGKEYQLSANQAVVQGAQQIFGVLGQKFKAAAIAGAIIATYQAVAKALASAPWPASLVLAAGALAAGLANVAKIRSSEEGWAQGTPGTAFMNFGRGSMQMLHHDEAVINRSQGDTLADQLHAAVSERDSRVASALDRMERAQARRDAALPLLLRDAVLLGTA